MTPDLPAHLRSFLERPFAWGRSDCSVFTASWFDACDGGTRMVRVAGRFDDARSMVRFYRDEAGFAREAARLFGSDEPVDLLAGDKPAPGDVVLLRVGRRPFLGIAVPLGVALRTRSGVGRTRPGEFTILAAWRRPWPSLPRSRPPSG